MLQLGQEMRGMAWEIRNQITGEPTDPADECRFHPRHSIASKEACHSSTT